MNFCDAPTRLPYQPPRKRKWKKRPPAEPTGPSGISGGGDWFKCKTQSWILPPPPGSSTGEPIGLSGFKFDDSDAARWELAPKDLEITTIQLLLRKFRREWRWWRKPILFARNPEKEGMPIFGHRDIALCYYPKGFYITIERYMGESFGPHAACLFYRSRQVPTEVAWVAICQLGAFWHSDDRLLKDLNHEIKNNRLYQSDETARTVVLQ